MKSLAVSVLVLVLGGSVAHAQEVAKLFNDSGKTYFRSDSAASLVVGAELPACSDAAGKKSAGKVVVMEVTGLLARVSLDDDAAKAGAKFVRLGNAPGEAPVAPAAASGAASLRATLVRGNGYILVRNDSKADFTGCSMTFPDRRTAPVADVAAGRGVQVRYGDIKPAPDLGDDWVTVRCAEGENDFTYGEPAKQNGLRGRVERRGGGLAIFNEGPTDWTQCDLIKPNGHHFMQGGLRAGASDSVRGGLFRPPAGPEVIQVTCAQGSVSRPVP